MSDVAPPGDPTSTNTTAAAPAAPRHWLRHGAGFLASGIIGLLVDMGVTSLLTRGFGLSPFTARLIAIAVAMVAAWQAHRRLTFAVTEPSTVSEFLKFAAVASTSVVTNYALYSVVLIAAPQTAPEVALTASSLGSMFVTYFGMRYGVFRNHDRG